MVLYLDNVGGSQIPVKVLKKFFPTVRNLLKIKRCFPTFNQANKLGQLSIDDMTSFTNYIETNQQ